MATKAQLLKENKELIKERSILQKKYDKLKYTRTQPTESGTKMRDDIIYTLREEKIQLTLDLSRAEREVLNKSTYINSFVSLPWWKRATFTEAELKTWFSFGEL